MSKYTQEQRDKASTEDVIGSALASAAASCDDHEAAWEQLIDLACQRNELLEALELIYDKWENGTPCQEADEDGQCYEGSNCGNAFKLSEYEENSILQAFENAGIHTALTFSKRSLEAIAKAEHP